MATEGGVWRCVDCAEVLAGRRVIVSDQGARCPRCGGRVIRTALSGRPVLQDASPLAEPDQQGRDQEAKPDAEAVGLVEERDEAGPGRSR
jgi:DNA-directed RNA polymerase subunit RPC12/RpoP